jgi:hypothetical protein
MHPMELLVDGAQVEARFGLFGDNANLDGRYVHGLRQTYHWLRNHIGCIRWYSEVMRLKRKLIFGPLEDYANLDARLVHSLHQTYHRLGNRFTRTR